MKKRCLIVLLLILPLSWTLAACDRGATLKPYYGQTITLTGRACAVDWDALNASEDGSTKISYRALIANHWSEIAFDGVVNTWAQGYTNADTLLSAVDDTVIPIAFQSDFRQMSFAFGKAKEKTVKITMAENYGAGSETLIRLETPADYDAISQQIDAKYLDAFNLQKNINEVGFRCVCPYDSDRDELYDSFFVLWYHRESSIGGQTTLTVEQYERGKVVLDTLSISNNYALMKEVTDGYTSLVILPLYPEIILDKNDAA